MGLTEYVMNETCPRKMFVPMLMRMETPMAAMNSRGSIHDVVDTMSREHDDGHDDGEGHEHLLDHALLHLCVVRRIARHRVSGPRESM